MFTSSPLGRSAERNADLAAIAIVAAVAILGLLTFRDYGLGWDDYTHAEYGGLLLRLYSSGFTDRRALSFVNLYAYGGGFDMLAALAAKLLPFDLFETRRLAGAVVGVIGLLITWRIGRRIGGPLAGLLAVALLATCPLFYGQMFMNPKDAPFAVAMALLTLALVRVFQEYPAPPVTSKVLLGIGLGLSLGTRIIGGMAAVYAVMALALITAVELRSMPARAALGRAWTFIVSLLPALLLAYAVMAIAWPWGVVDPLNPVRALVYFSHFFEHPWRELFEGARIPVPDMPRRYVPELFLLKLPEIMVALGLSGMVGALWAATRRTIPPAHRAALLLVVLAAVFPIALTVATRPAMYNGIRHFVFLTPAMAGLGGLAGAWIITQAAKFRPAAAVATALIIAIGLVLPIVHMGRLHPYEYTHYNLLAGGTAAARDRYMLDYWGLSFKQASEELLAAIAQRRDAPTGRSRWRVAVCGPHRSVQVVLGPDFDLGWDPKGADFVIALGEFYCRNLQAPILAEVRREGVAYARVYDIRGMTVDNLLTIPAPAQ
jgi:4-amino-4-deoxy-L-arabinose transferase-like glycosyltransferase